MGALCCALKPRDLQADALAIVSRNISTIRSETEKPFVCSVQTQLVRICLNNMAVAVHSCPTAAFDFERIFKVLDALSRNGKITPFLHVRTAMMRVLLSVEACGEQILRAPQFLRASVQLLDAFIAAEYYAVGFRTYADVRAQLVLLMQRFWPANTRPYAHWIHTPFTTACTSPACPPQLRCALLDAE